MAKYNVFDTYETIGNFWFDDAKKDKYSGVLKYSPIEGITLQILCENNAPKEVKRVYGITDEFNKVTLTEAFFSRGPLTSAGRDYHIIKLNISARRLAIGIHLSEQEEVNIQKVSFSMNQLDEFCCPHGCKDLDEYIKGNLFKEAWGNNTSASLSQNVTYNLSGGAHNFYIENDEFKNELADKLATMCDKYGESLYKIKDIQYRIAIEKEGRAFLNLNDFFDEMYNFRSLFFILVLKPIYFQSISITYFFPDETEERRSYEILVSPKLDERGLKNAQKDEIHHFLPIKLSDIKDSFSDLSQKWLGFSKKSYYENLIGLIYTMLYTDVNIETAAFYYAAFMKVIRQWALGHNQNSQYYDWFINSYASEAMKTAFVAILQKINEDVQVDKIGKELADIRNYIEHADVPNEGNEKRFQKYNQKITKLDYLNFCELFYVLFLKALYQDLGLPIAYFERNDEPFRRWQPS